MNNINLNFFDFTGNGKVLALSGRPKGEKIREEWKLDDLEKNTDNVFIVNIPKEMYGLSPSLIQGIFTKTIDTLGKQNFYERYKFSPHESLLSMVQLGIDGIPDKQ